MKTQYNDHRGSTRKGGKTFGSRTPWKRGADRDQDRPALHDAICGKCGSACQVPFRPTGSRPVLCLNCFKRDDTGAAPKRFGDKRPYSKSFGDKGPSDNLGTRLAAIERKLDTILEALSSDEKLF